MTGEVQQTNAVRVCNLADYVPEFLSSQTKPGTAATHSDSIKQFLSWCNSSGVSIALEESNSIDASTIESWLAYLKDERSSSQNTLAVRSWSLRAFFTFLIRQQAIAVSPFEDISKVSTVRSRPNPAVGPVALRRLIASGKDATPLDDATVALIASVGLSVVQACRAKIDDFGTLHSGSKIILVPGRAGTRVALPVTGEAQESVDRIRGERDSGILLNRKSGRPLDAKTVNRIIARHAARSGLDPRITAEAVRRSVRIP